MNNWKKALSFSLALLVVAVLTACGDNNEESNSDQAEAEQAGAESEQASSETEVNAEEITIGQINWAENIAITNMWKAILEDKGYNVKLSVLDMGTMMQALETGDLDVSLEVWLPVQDANYLEEYQDTVNFSEATWFDNAKVGLVVPTYLEDINSVEDLNEHKELFDGKIVGFDPGAGTMEVTEQLIEDYNLDFELLPSSEPAMLAEIGEAVKNEEPIVAPLWTPHWIFSKYDIKFLEDPQETYGGVEKIHHATRQDFADDYPNVSEYFKNWKMNDEQIGELIDYVENAEEPLDGAKKWVEENQELVDEWVK
ncbi:glycine betaine ABC transporter substrate-binding protein [Tenuibacillus multivorans]|uniref:Glycine betaine/proline transport system substrate-binding protein n=1 Tax=Tenuibacillus multivorans TaxID=237069 RepID=A0A1H0EB40_9BACI|nr:glycine betaine ABC transporter substrate-binding protein [Tenuibacillus multivorans]GEL78737.1 glycine/betaine ABC transporter [Tenuibacillus multivorans]SDN79516.1 glycine betaine/proline transport system substrate-binding protein [Tenuibacillus multivorans]